MAAAVQAPPVIGPNIRDLVLQEKLKLVTAGGPLGTTRTLYTGVLVPCTDFPNATNPSFWCVDGVYRPFYFCENGYLKPIWRWAKTIINGDTSYRWYNNQTNQFIYINNELPKMPIMRDALSNPSGAKNRIFKWNPVNYKWEWNAIELSHVNPYTSLPLLDYNTPYTFLNIDKNHCPIDDPYDLDYNGQPLTYQAPVGAGILQISSHFPKKGGKRKTKSRKHKKSRRSHR